MTVPPPMPPPGPTSFPPQPPSATITPRSASPLPGFFGRLGTSPRPGAATIGGETYRLLLAQLRDIRAEAQHLVELLSEFQTPIDLTDPAARRAEVATKLASLAPLVEADASKVGARLAVVHELLAAAPALHDWAGDEITRLENAWDRALVRSLPAVASASDSEQLRGYLEQAEHSLGRVIQYAARLTIPSRLNDHLAALRPGQTLDFHATFSDELPDVGARAELLRFLAAHPLDVAGLVDAEHGRIYRVAPSARRRWASLGLIFALVVLGGIVPVVLTRISGWTGAADWPIEATRSTELLAAYVFIVLGAVAHLVVDALKQVRSEDRQRITALNDLVLWSHVKELPHATAVVSLWIGLIGLAFTTDPIGWELAFFVGYSIDSVVDLFVGRFTAAASTRVAAIEQRVM